MKAARIHRFGPPDVIVIDDLARPVPAANQVLVRVAGAGVGPWDALIREGTSAVHSPLPLTLGSDLSGVVEAVGPGAGGNVGSYAVQFAKQAGLQVFATASADDLLYVQRLGATTVIDYKRQRFEDVMPMADVVLDLVGGETQSRSLKIIKPGGILVSVVSKPIPRLDDRKDIRVIFFLAEVTTERLERITDFFNEGKLMPRVGTVVPLEDVRMAHQMLAGAPHKPGKIVLSIADRAPSSPKTN